MNKAAKSEVLKHWFGIDQILFNGPAKNFLDEDVLKQYLSTKGALLSNLFEVYKKIGYKPENNFKTVADMSQAANELAENFKNHANEILSKTSVLKLVKEEIKELGSTEGLTEEQVAKYVVLKRRNATALDAMLFEAFTSLPNKDALNDWQGKVLIDAHKSLRDSLIDISLQ